MTNLTKVFLFVYLAALFPSFSAAEVKTLTNRRGIKIDADVLAVDGSTVKFKRVSDGRIFEIPISSLIQSDQAWLKAMAGRSAPQPGGKWLPLTVEIPLPTLSASQQKPEVIGMRRTLTAIKTGATTFDMLLPSGAWVILDVKSYDGSSSRSDYLVKFNGERHWKPRFKEGLLLLSRDGGPEEVAGVPLAEDEDELPALIEKVKRYKPGLSTCLSVPYRIDYDEMPSFGSSQLALVIKSTTSSTPNLEKRIGPNVKALSISLYRNTLSELEHIEELEALDLRLSTDRDDTDPIPSLTYLPRVKDLTIDSFPNNFTLHTTLLKQGGLRCLRVRPKDYRNKVLFLGINQLKSLESIDLSGFQLDAKEFSSLVNLRAVTIGNDLFREDDPGLAGLSNIKGVQYIDKYHDSFSDAFNNWAKAGGLSELEKLHGGEHFNPKYSPKLRYVDFGSLSDLEDQVSIRGYGGLEHLEYFEVTGVDLDNWRKITSFKSRTKLKSMKMMFSGRSFFGDQDDHVAEATIKKLTPFTSLRFLNIYGGEFKKVDLSMLPQLEAFEIQSDEVVQEITGLADHKSLRSIRTYSCDKLTGITGEGANHILQVVNLENCPLLSDVSGLNIANNLRIAQVRRCDSLRDPQPFLDSNQLLEVQVYSCKLLRDRRITR